MNSQTLDGTSYEMSPQPLWQRKMPPADVSADLSPGSGAQSSDHTPSWPTPAFLAALPAVEFGSAEAFTSNISGATSNSCCAGAFLIFQSPLSGTCWFRRTSVVAARNCRESSPGDPRLSLCPRHVRRTRAPTHPTFLLVSSL